MLKSSATLLHLMYKVNAYLTEFLHFFQIGTLLREPCLYLNQSLW